MSASPLSHLDDLAKVCAVVVTYHIGVQIFACVDAIASQVGGVIIVDNGSGPETLKALREVEARPRLRVIYNADNLGIGRALNQGVEYALQQGYRWVLTLDHDSEATPGMVEKLLQVYEVLGDTVGIVAPNPFDRNAHAFRRPDVRQRTGYAVTHRPVNSSGSLIAAATFKKVGLFNELLFLYYVDDEFCARVRQAGLGIAIHGGAVLLHSEGHQVSKRFLWRELFYDRYSKEARYYIARNGIYMTARYPAEMRYGYVCARRLVADLVKVILYDDHPLAKVGYTLKGLWDGLRGKYGSLGSPTWCNLMHRRPGLSPK